MSLQLCYKISAPWIFTSLFILLGFVQCRECNEDRINMIRKGIMFDTQSWVFFPFLFLSLSPSLPSPRQASKRARADCTIIPGLPKCYETLITTRRAICLSRVKIYCTPPAPRIRAAMNYFVISLAPGNGETCRSGAVIKAPLWSHVSTGKSVYLCEWFINEFWYLRC